MKQIREILGGHLERALEPPARLLVRCQVTPNQISVAAALLNVATGVLVIAEYPMVAAVLYLVAGSFDMLDGLVARLANRATAFGAFLGYRSSR